MKSVNGSGLVTKALLVAVLLHPLLALVLGDFGLSTLLDGSHLAVVLGCFR